MDYLEIKMKVQPAEPWSDLIADDMLALGFESFVSSDEGFSAFIEEDRFNEKALKELPILSDSAFEVSWEATKHVAQNWNEEWEKNFSPIEVNQDCVVRASFHPDPQVKYDLLIDPKMAFGTGHHQTTFLILNTMFDLSFDKTRVLDMGTGTGVLGILAAKFGATEIVGIDNNQWACASARENVVANGVQGMTIIEGEEEAVSGTFDYVLANINRNIVADQLELYASVLNPGGHVLTSGFFMDDEPIIKEKAELAGLKHIETRSKENWAMVHFAKPE